MEGTHIKSTLYKIKEKTMDDTRHISYDQYEEIECALDDLIHNAKYDKDKAKDECINVLLDILCLEKPE